MLWRLQVILISIFGGFGIIISWGIFILTFLGGAYWLWLAIIFKSFWMFALGIFPLTAMLFAGPLGIYSFLFGTPQWLVNMFG